MHIFKTFSSKMTASKMAASDPSYFTDFEHVKFFSCYFADFEQVKKICSRFATLNKSEN